MIDERGNAVVRRDREEPGRELLAAGDVHRLQRVREAGLLQVHRELVAVRRRPVVEVEHADSRGQNVPG